MDVRNIKRLKSVPFEGRSSFLETYNQSTIILDENDNTIIENGTAKVLALTLIADPNTEIPTKEGQIAQKKDGSKGLLIAEKDGDGNLYWIDKIGAPSSVNWGYIGGNITFQTDLKNALSSKQDIDQKNQPNGYPSLDADGTINCNIE